MKKGKNTAENSFDDDELDLDDIELLEDGGHDRTLVLKAVPRSRRLQLIAQGAREIRCSSCCRIRPLANAEESEEGWICEDCAGQTVSVPDR